MGSAVATGKKPIVVVSFKTESKHGEIYIPLTSKDIKNLKESWPLVKQHWLAICAIAFERWFSIYPELRYMFKHFPTPSELSLSELLQSHTLKLHVDKVEQVIDSILSKVDHPTEFVNALITMGEAHYHFQADQKYATHLAAALQYGVTTTLKCKPDVENAWDSLFRFIMDCLKLGMREEQRKEENPYTIAKHFEKESNSLNSIIKTEGCLK